MSGWKGHVTTKNHNNQLTTKDKKEHRHSTPPNSSVEPQNPNQKKNRSSHEKERKKKKKIRFFFFHFHFHFSLCNQRLTQMKIPTKKGRKSYGRKASFLHSFFPVYSVLFFPERIELRTKGNSIQTSKFPQSRALTLRASFWCQRFLLIRWVKKRGQIKRSFVGKRARRRRKITFVVDFFFFFSELRCKVI